MNTARRVLLDAIEEDFREFCEDVGLEFDDDPFDHLTSEDLDWAMGLMDEKEEKAYLRKLLMPKMVELQNSIDKWFENHVKENGETDVRCPNCRRMMFFGYAGGHPELSCACGECKSLQNYLGLDI